MNTDIPYKTYLSEDELPKAWYNVRADMTKKPAPLLDAKTRQPVTAAALESVFCREAVRQELDDVTPCIPIPEPVRDFYRMYRPSPLVHAVFLEKALDTPALFRRLGTKLTDGFRAAAANNGFDLVVCEQFFGGGISVLRAVFFL